MNIELEKVATAAARTQDQDQVQTAACEER